MFTWQSLSRSLAIFEERLFPGLPIQTPQAIATPGIPRNMGVLLSDDFQEILPHLEPAWDSLLSLIDWISDGYDRNTRLTVFQALEDSALLMESIGHLHREFLNCLDQAGQEPAAPDRAAWLGRSDGAVRNIAHFGNHLCLKAHQPLEKSLRLTESIPDGKCKAQGEARDVSNHDPTIVHLPLLAQVSVLRGIRATEGAFWLKTDLVAGSVGSQKV
eukprot:s2094_g6.t1